MKNARDRRELRKCIACIDRYPAATSPLPSTTKKSRLSTQAIPSIIISWYPLVLSLNVRIRKIYIRWEIGCEAEASAGTSRSNWWKLSILHGLLRVQWDTKQQKYDSEDNGEKPQYLLFTTHLWGWPLTNSFHSLYSFQALSYTTRSLNIIQSLQTIQSLILECSRLRKAGKIASRVDVQKSGSSGWILLFLPHFVHQIAVQFMKHKDSKCAQT